MEENKRAVEQPKMAGGYSFWIVIAAIKDGPRSIIKRVSLRLAAEGVGGPVGALVVFA